MPGVVALFPNNLKKVGKAMSLNKRTLHLSGESAAMINGNSFGLGNAEVKLEYCADIMDWLLTASNVDAEVHE